MDNCQLKIYTFVGWVIFVHPLPVNGAKPDVRHVNHRRRTHVLYVICSTVTLYSHYSPEVDDIFSKKSQNPRHLKMSGWQILAFLGGLVGLGATIGATVSNEWKATSRASSVITATWVLQGLWNNCAGNAIGALHCRPHHTIFKLEGYIQVCRGLMIAAICLGFFGAIFALVGMKCTKIGGSDQNKARIAFLSGVNFILSGLCSLSACSLYAHRITSEFFDPMFVAQKYELGAALFIGWAGSILCLLGGLILSFSIGDSFPPKNSGRYGYRGSASRVSSHPRAHAQPIHQKPPPDYSNSSRAQHFDKNAYV
ncbi:claudin-10-like isoform X1 [Hypomesus transpacificus]|uniref:claudin-10-like isoform X1 n=1 Tax=Hypomesus transpacificus TaxID=137520 RepID=UPI001F07B8B8|nr:claudin-10-like isoform X1 [Hypomesus transpacificus]